jgi:lipopolysaccharide transport system ATP-binding protein
MQTVIKVEGLGKLYRLGEVGTGTLSHDLKRWWYRVRGKEDPYLKIGQVNDRTQRAEKGELVWALRDINLEVQQGEVLGVIGKNGAGKSTLLKILSRITSPTEGIVKVKGRIASLLEVGTGFHPEMTGRENIYMNGTLMGMRRWEIDKKLDEIVEFAGVAKYIDTPVKRYSSGMTVRLGFAVAAHLNAEILLVDEVLAVGDAEFQKKALGKMHEVSHDQGRTVLFVSHNMGAVKNLCQRGIVLNNGQIQIDSNIEMAIENYISLNQVSNSDLEYYAERAGNGDNIQDQNSTPDLKK